MSGQQGGGGGNNDNLIFGAIGVFLVFAMLFSITGWVAALINTAGGSVPSSDVSDMPRILVGIFTNAAEPNLAWPEEDQDIVPGAGLFYLTFILLVVLFSAIAWFGYNFYQDRFAGGGGKLGQKSTQWARKSDIKQLVIRETTPGRLTLGRVGSALIATELRHSVIVMGPTQSGKTTGLAVPAILEWEGPVIATSVKNDLAEDTLEWRRRKGHVWVYDPTAATGLPTSTWSPLDGARDWAGAKKIAAWLTSSAKSSSKGLSDGDFWYSAAGKLLGPHLFAAAANGYTMADVVRWIDTQEEYEVRALLASVPGPDGEDAMRAADASWQREDRARSSIYTTAEVVIEAYSDPTVLASARGSEIQASKFLDGGQHTLYVCAPSHEQDRLRPVFSTLLRQIIRAAYDQAPLRPGRKLDPTMLIVLDEAANIAPLDDLDSIASTCSGLGIQLVTVWQDMAQINNRYGDRAQTVVNNHRAKVVLSGISDTSTLDYVSRLIGNEEVRSTSTTRDAQGSKSTTTSTSDKNLAPADVVRRIKMNEGVLIYGALLPARLTLRPWYNNKRLTAMRNNDLGTVRKEEGHANSGGSGAPKGSSNGRATNNKASAGGSGARGSGIQGLLLSFNDKLQGFLDGNHKRVAVGKNDPRAARNGQRQPRDGRPAQRGGSRPAPRGQQSQRAPMRPNGQGGSNGRPPARRNPYNGGSGQGGNPRRTG